MSVVFPASSGSRVPSCFPGAAAQHSAPEKHRGGADQLQRKTWRPDRAKAVTEKQATIPSFPLFTRYLPEVTGDMRDLLVMFLRNLQIVEQDVRELNIFSRQPKRRGKQSFEEEKQGNRALT